MGAAPRDRGMTNHALAAETFLTIAPVHPMPHLKCAALSVCSLVIRNRRAFESYGVFQNRLHRAIEAVYLRVAQVAARFPRMDLRTPQRFVRIDVAHPADHTLIQQQRLDVRIARLNPRAEFFL